MAIYTQPNLSSGMDDGLIEIATTSQAFPIGLLLFTFIIVLMGGSSAQNRRTGYADMPFWSLLASISCLLLSLIMSLKSGIITGYTLSVVVAINILTAIWFFNSKGRYEN